MGVWANTVVVTAAIEAIARNGERPFDRTYWSSEEEQVILDPAARKNEAMINGVVNDLLTKLFADHALLEFLARQ